MLVEGGIEDGWWLVLHEPYDGAVSEDNHMVLRTVAVDHVPAPPVVVLRRGRSAWCVVRLPGFGAIAGRLAHALRAVAQTVLTPRAVLVGVVGVRIGYVVRAAQDDGVSPVVALRDRFLVSLHHGVHHV
ncbi:MAG: hypothetical protein ACRDTF_21805 [Pseudonocardiaceae bacterium]